MTHDARLAEQPWCAVRMVGSTKSAEEHHRPSRRTLPHAGFLAVAGL